MATSVTLPALGESVTEGTVTRWLKQPGDQVAVDEPLLEVSTDKVDTEIPSPVAGTLLEIKVQEDETVEVGAELCVIGEAGESGGTAGDSQPAEEAEAYLDLPESIQPRRTGGSRSGPIELLQYQNRHVFHDIHIWTGSPLDDLRKLAASLAQSYPWEPAQAAAFVLEGLIPLATPFTLHFPQTWHSTRPRRAKVVMEVELWMPAAAVLRAYRDLQRKVLPGYNRQLSRRSIALVTFVLRNRPATWQMLLDRWNNEHPNWRFPDYRRLRTAFKRAEKSLLQPRYEPYLGPRD